MSDLDPVLVAARLEEARRLYVPVRLDEIREEPPPADLRPETVQARLDELRELLRLAEYLGQARIEPG